MKDLDYISAIFALMLATIRLGLAINIVPFIGTQTPAGLPRRGILLACTGICLPILVPQVAGMTFTPVLILALVIKELLLGLLLGFSAAIIFWAIESAGELVDLQRGTTIAGVFNPQFGATVSPVGNLFVRLVSAVFFATGGFTAFLSAVFASYLLFPISSLLPEWSPAALQVILGLMQSYFQIALLYAAPFLIAFFLIDFGLGLMNRFVPQLNVFFFSLPVKSAVTFFFLLFYTTTLVFGFGQNLYTPEQYIELLKRLFA